MSKPTQGRSVEQQLSADSVSRNHNNHLSLLAVDDDPQVLTLLRTVFGSELEIFTTADPNAAMDLVKRKRPGIAIINVAMQATSGTDMLERFVEADPGVDIIVISGDSSPHAAVEAIQKGACDYLTKPVEIELLKRRITQLVTEAHKRLATLALDRELLAAYDFQGMIGRSPALFEVFSKIRRISRHFRTVLISGATGTGKELVAKALHDLSPVANSRFVPYNCGAIVETLIESELFGHVKGAFTGASHDKVGGFEYADGGVLFLDEVGELPLSAQTRLLRVLQQQEVQRVGSPVSRKVDVRVVAATHRDLRAMMEQGRFRDDLYYRLSSIEIQVPALVERKEDIPLLLRHFLARLSARYGKTIRGLTRRAQALLMKYSWPGNIRELENVLSHACMMTDSEVIDVMDLPQRVREPHATVTVEGGLVSLEEAQNRYVLSVLAAVNGDKIAAAKILKISRATLYRILAAAFKNIPGTGDIYSNGQMQNEFARITEPSHD